MICIINCTTNKKKPKNLKFGLEVIKLSIKKLSKLIFQPCIDLKTRSFSLNHVITTGTMITKTNFHILTNKK